MWDEKLKGALSICLSNDDFNITQKNILDILLNNDDVKMALCLFTYLSCKAQGRLFLLYLVGDLSMANRDFINHRIEQKDCDQYDVSKQYMQEYLGISTLRALLNCERNIGYDVLFRSPYLVDKITSDTLCSADALSLPPIASMCASIAGIHLLNHYESIHAKITKAAFNKAYTISIGGMEQAMTCLQSLLLVDKGCELLIHNTALLNLVDDNILNTAFTFGNQTFHPIHILTGYALRYHSGTALEILLNKVSADTLNNAIDGEASFLQERVDDIENIYLLDNENVINKLSVEGINRYYDGRNVLAVLSSCEEGMELLEKHADVFMQKATDAGLNAPMRSGYATDGLSTIAALARTVKGLCILDVCPDLENKINDWTLDCCIEGYRATPSLRTLLTSHDTNVLSDYVNSKSGRVLILKANNWEMAYNASTVDNNQGQNNFTEAAYTFFSIHSPVRCAITGCPMSNPVKIHIGDRAIDETAYDYHAIFWHLFLYKTIPGRDVIVLNNGQNPDTILRPNNQLKDIIDDNQPDYVSSFK